MSTDLVITLQPQKVDTGWFVEFDLWLFNIGFRPQRGRTTFSGPIGVVIDDEQDSEIIPWPPGPPSFDFHKGLLVRYGLFGRRDRTHCFGLTYWFNNDRQVETVWVGFSVPPFLGWYSDAWIDMTKRIVAITEYLAKMFTVKSAVCSSDSGKAWLEFSNGAWTVLPDLKLQETSEHAIPSMLNWVNKPDVPFVFDETTASIRYTGISESVPFGRLSRNPFDGCRLPDPLRRSTESDPNSDLDQRFRKACWTGDPGPRGVLAMLGGNHAEVPIIEPPRSIGAIDDSERVDCLFVVEPNGWERAGLLRVLRNGRVASIPVD